MALTLIPCWALVLATCLVLSVNADCGQDCALCIFRLQGKPSEINAPVCSLECEGQPVTMTLVDLCKDTLQGGKERVLNEEAQAGVPNGDDDLLRLQKKYGGFMKRYGGFMKKADEAGPVPSGEGGDTADGLTKRYGGFMKKDEGADRGRLSILKELLNPEGFKGAIEAADAVKRYGGFMRSPEWGADQQGGAKELHKRYGGFMRRVGRPAWKDDEKRLAGLLQEDKENLPEMEKRYGGFMD